MPVDHIRYDVLVQEALRGMVRDVLNDLARRKTFPGEHHFYITFDTTADGVQLSEKLRAQYPEEMTIVLQHQFWDLKVTDAAFDVGLSFGGVAERLHIPFSAIKAFADPSVQFTLQFEALPAADDQEQGQGDEAPPIKAKGQAPARAATHVPAPAPEDKTPQQPSAGAEVVRLDRFRKK